MKKLALCFALMLLLVSSVSYAADRSDVMTVPPADAAEWRDRIVVANSAQITTLDPTRMYNQVHNRLYTMVYDRLLRLEDGRPAPELAVEWKWNDDSFTSLWIKLRDGVKFHDGTPLTTADVDFTLGRQTYTLVSSFYDHAEIISDLEMNIFLKEPDADFLYALTANCAAIISKKATEADPDRGSAIGSGPWIIDLSTYVVGDTIEVVRNDAYWGKKPVTQRVVFRYISDASTRHVALQNDEVQITDIAKIELDLAKANPDIEVREYDSTNIYYMAFNNRDGTAADDLNLRRAIARAIDRELITAAVGDDGARTSETLYSWTMPSFKTEFDLDLSYNLEEAKKLADAAKSKHLKVMAITSSPIYKPIIETIQEECRKIGVTIEIEEVDSAGLTANSRYNTAKQQALIYAAGLFPWDCHVWPFFTAGSNVNKGVLDDPRIVELMRLSRATDDEQKRREYNFEIQDIVHEQCYYIPMYFAIANSCARRGLGGISLHVNGVHDYRYICMPK